MVQFIIFLYKWQNFANAFKIINMLHPDTFLNPEIKMVKHWKLGKLALRPKTAKITIVKVSFYLRAYVNECTTWSKQYFIKI